MLRTVVTRSCAIRSLGETSAQTARICCSLRVNVSYATSMGPGRLFSGNNSSEPGGVYQGGIPSYMPPYCTLGGIPSLYASLPIPPWVHHHAYQPQVYQMYCTEQRTVGGRRALGSKREKPLGESHNEAKRAPSC